MQIPFFDYPQVYRRFATEFQHTLEDVGRRGAFIQQEELSELEAALADYVGASHCVAVANATVGLQLGMTAGGVPDQSEVIISSHTMVATAESIHFAGAKSVPVEIGPDHLIDPEAVRAAITERTSAICPTQLNGRTCDMDAIQAIADEHGLAVFEDAAQALGSKYRGKSAGTWGRASCLSFYPAKILGTLGDGGAVLTSDDDIADQLRLLRDHGRVNRGETVIWGHNARMDNLAAAFLLVQFRHFGETVRRRRDIARRYEERLAGLPGLKLPPAPDSDPDHFDTFQNYEIECEWRDQLQAYLRDQGIGTLQQWGGWPIHKFRKLGFNQDLPFTDHLFARMLMLPMNMALTDDQVDYVCDSVIDFVNSREESA